MTKTKLQRGERAAKVGGAYQAEGTIVAAFRTTQGAERYVFEFDSPAGMLLIYGPSQLESLEEPLVSVSGIPYQVSRADLAAKLKG